MAQFEQLSSSHFIKTALTNFKHGRQLSDNSPLPDPNNAENRNKTKIEDLEPTARAAWDSLVQNVELKTRMYKFSSYDNCFLGTEAVDVLVGDRIFINRDEAVATVLKLQQGGLVEHVTNDHAFMDDPRFYRFTKDVSAIRKSSAGDVALSRQQSQGENQRKTLVDESCLEALSDTCKAAYDCLQQKVEVKNRKHKFKTYNMCFIAKEAVDVLVDNHICRTRDSAVDTMIALQNVDLLKHVTNGHVFKDEHLFFRFTAESNNSSKSMSPSLARHTSAEFVRRSKKEDQSAEDVELIISEVEHVSMNSILSPIMGDGLIYFFEETYRAAYECLTSKVEVKNRTYHLKTYKDCFLGNEAVDALCNNHICPTRELAVTRIQHLQDAGLVVHATQGHKFKDEKLFYRFVTPDGKIAESTWKSEKLVPSTDPEPPATSNINEGAVATKAKDVNLDIVCKAAFFCLQQKLDIRDRETYKRSFVGSEAVDTLVDNQISTSRDEAEATIKRLQDASLVEHVTKSDTFKDEKVLYRFTRETL